MPAYRLILIVSIALLLIIIIDQPVSTADDIPEIFDYSFDQVGSIKIYAGPVVFAHARHVTDYGLSCNACHHTLEDDEMEVEEHCRDCHTEAGFIQGKKADELGEEELIEHYLNALHVQCIGCHKQKKIENRNRKIPVGCTQCHDRTKLPSPK
jgi:hypothetical protein